jgi:hypothetical protein
MHAHLMQHNASPWGGGWPCFPLGDRNSHGDGRHCDRYIAIYAHSSRSAQPCTREAAGVVSHAAWDYRISGDATASARRSLTNFERHQAAIEVRILGVT